VILACASAERRVITTDDALARLVGCYRLTLGKWSGGGEHRDRFKWDPPAVFRLDSMPLPAPLDRGGGRRVVPHIFPSLMPAQWFTSGDSLVIVWGMGLGGVSLIMRERDSSWVGEAKIGTDVYDPDPWRAKARASQTSCTGEEELSVSVRGMVVTMTGQPLGNVYIQLNDDPRLGETQSFGDGRFWLFGVPTGSYRLHAGRCPYEGTDVFFQLPGPTHPLDLSVHVEPDPRCNRDSTE